jgi:hypothetical protein
MKLLADMYRQIGRCMQPNVALSAEIAFDV